VRPYSEAGCFEDKLIYENDLEQIISLINISESCEQHVINNCTNNVLSDMAWWTDRNGNKVEYWDGDHPLGTEGCKCSLDGSGCDLNLNGDSVCLSHSTSCTAYMTPEESACFAEKMKISSHFISFWI